MENAEYVIATPQWELGEEKSLVPIPLPWDRFEEEVAAHIRKLVKERSLGLDEESCKVFRRKAYFSKTRESEIIFDVALEVRSPPDAVAPLLLWIWECKDYPNRTVGVDEVEEFAEKLRQVGAHKGTIATRKGFQSGAESVARTYRIGLITLNKERHCTIMFSIEGRVDLSIELTSSSWIDSSGKSWTGENMFLEDILSTELDGIP